MQEDRLWNENGSAAKITVKDWLKIDCIMLLSIIPVLGTIAAIIIYIVLAFDKSTAISIKNRIKADLIWMLIFFIISLVAIIVVLCLAMSMQITLPAMPNIPAL